MGLHTTLPPGATPLAAADFILSVFGRKQVELAIETLIAKLDAADGDPDSEDDDPAGSLIDLREGDHADWGYRPAYGADQSAGPINAEEVDRGHYRMVLCGMTDAEIAASNRGATGFRPTGAA